MKKNYYDKELGYVLTPEYEIVGMLIFDKTYKNYMVCEFFIDREHYGRKHKVRMTFCETYSDIYKDRYKVILQYKGLSENITWMMNPEPDENFELLVDRAIDYLQGSDFNNYICQIFFDGDVYKYGRFECGSHRK